MIARVDVVEHCAQVNSNGAVVIQHQSRKGIGCGLYWIIGLNAIFQMRVFLANQMRVFRLDLSNPAVKIQSQ